MFELLRNPTRSFKIFYLGAIAFVALSFGVIDGQGSDNSSFASVAVIWLGYALLPFVILPFAVQSGKIRTQVYLCFVVSVLITTGFMFGYNSVNEGQSVHWYDPLVIFFFALTLLFPMLIFSAIWYGIVKLLEHYRLVPSFLRV